MPIKGGWLGSEQQRFSKETVSEANELLRRAIQISRLLTHFYESLFKYKFKISQHTYTDVTTD
jgi:hypothetical protein